MAKKPKKAKKKTPDPELERKSLSWQAQQLALKTPRVDYGERGPDPSASRKHLQPDFVLNSIQHTRDKSKKRGVSVIRSTAPRLYLKSMQKFELPVPVINPARRKEFPGNPDHGLWQFFYEKKAMQTPEGMANHGRAWTYAELALKSFEDLHALYWVCHKEVNRVMTNTRERKRIHAGYGDFEDEQRIKTVSTTWSFSTPQAFFMMNITLSLAEMIASGPLKPLAMRSLYWKVSDPPHKLSLI